MNSAVLRRQFHGLLAPLKKVFQRIRIQVRKVHSISVAMIWFPFSSTTPWDTLRRNDAFAGESNVCSFSFHVHFDALTRDPLHGIDIKVYSQIKFCRNSTLYPWANNLAGTLLFIAAAAGGGGGGWLYMPVCRVLARAWGTTHSTTKHVWKYSWHMCTNYLHRHAPSFESSKITIRANNKNWCYMIFGAFVVLSLLLIII